ASARSSSARSMRPQSSPRPKPPSRTNDTQRDSPSPPLADLTQHSAITAPGGLLKRIPAYRLNTYTIEHALAYFRAAGLVPVQCGPAATAMYCLPLTA